MAPFSRRYYEVIEPPIKVAGQLAQVVEVDQVVEIGPKGQEVVLQQTLKVLWGMTRDELKERLLSEKAELDSDVAIQKQAIDEKIALVEAAVVAETAEVTAEVIKK